MRTQFSAAQLSDPHIADAEKSLRACMHCGICTATCPTYVLLGDERDGPRGRIVMMQDMLERNAAPTAETVLHIDRCLSCLACRTACPSSVDYAKLVDLSREHIEAHYRRPLVERLFRFFIAHVMPRPLHLRTALALSRVFAPVVPFLPGRLRQMARTGSALPKSPRSDVKPKMSEGARRVAVLPGCVQSAVAPQIDDALARVLARRGSEALVLPNNCCGSLLFHLGRTDEARSLAKRVIVSFERSGAESVTISATGCSAHMKSYADLFRGDPVWEGRAKSFAEKFRDLSEVITPRDSWPPRPLRVAYHSACSAENGLRLRSEPQELLRRAGFEVVEIPEGHLCCGSAGSYSLLQPEISGALRSRKLGNIAAVRPDVIATGNIGCLIQLTDPDAPPVVHYAELLDWVEGGVKPQALLRPKVEVPRAAE
jgi:glycolate oxidase iron-sulfur subunit